MGVSLRSSAAAASGAPAKSILVTGATGDTGRPTVELLLTRGHRVKALARKDDDRSRKLRDLGAEIVFGDMRKMSDMRAAMEGVSRAYFVYPLFEGQVEATVIFAQAAKEQSLEHVANMSHKQSRPLARSPATMAHWLSEQVLAWSGLSHTNLRVTFFAEWLLYIAPFIREGKYIVPFDPDSRFAPMPASDIAKVVVGILEHPEKHAGKSYPLHGPVEYSHKELAAVIGRVLGRDIQFEQVSVSKFLEMRGLAGHSAYQNHFESVKVDQQEGLLRGTDPHGTEIIGGPLMTIEEFISNHRDVMT